MKRSYVQDDSGKVQAVRETTNDGRTSYLYRADDSISGLLLRGGKGECIEVADHDGDGTTRAYEADNSITGHLLHGGKGRAK
jgi:hypothetical protein